MDMERTYNQASFSLNQAEAFARKSARFVVIRTFVDGCSADIKRRSSKSEMVLLENLILSVLLVARSGFDVESAVATAEKFAYLESPDINTHASLYSPISGFLESVEAA